ncbi:MAG: hypothetical protein JWQ34_2119 [Mucilaginibacter sp.]|uniref:hypothetical protein n=1 Tax=Mucilaginibacter sp. TaxID=1882438 RepID=UPI00262C8A6A|nr:hypothetical protein [Mucilaginibacter sp.]MDB5003894.1 hypothetical protein [Mucilaginibacter sp.]
MEISDFNITQFQNLLLAWFKKNRRDFPWRLDGLTSYQLIISEILLQRTKAETASNFYSLFIAEFPDWKSLANSSQENLSAFLRPIGLYNQRATRLIQLAKHMLALNSKIPLERERIDKIPFMGQYIANAVELLIHERQKPLIDVNMARVLERYFGPREKADIRYDDYLQTLAHRVVKHENSKEISWAILDFAAIICQARKPKCLECSLSENCKFFNNCIIPYI